MMGIFGGGSQSVKQRSEPWSGAQGSIREALQGYEDLWDSGQMDRMFRYGPHSMVPGMNRDFRGGLQALRGGYQDIADTAQGNLGLQRGLRSAGRLARGRGTGLGALSPFARNALSSTAQGDYLYGGEGFNNALQASIDATSPLISGQFSGAGRTGSAYHAKALGDAASNAFAGLYNTERGRQMNAANTMAGLGQQGVQQQMQAQGMLPGLAQAQFMPGQMQMNAGNQLMQGGAQRYGLYDSPAAAENVQRWQQNRRAPLSALDAYRGAAYGAGGLGGTSSGGQSGGGPGFLPGLMGTALTGLGIARGFGWGGFGGGGGGNPFMAGAGYGMGY